VDESKFVGVIQRLSLTGGSAVLAKGPIPRGAMGEMILNTVFGKVSAQIEFLQTGADGVRWRKLSAFSRWTMTAPKDSTRPPASGERGLQRCLAEQSPLSVNAPLGQLLRSVRRLAATLSSSRS